MFYACCIRLQLNVLKSVIIQIGSWQKLRDRCVSIFINGTTLARVADHSYRPEFVLEISVLKRVRYKLYTLRHLNPLPDHLLSQLYQAFVLSVFDHCDAVWMLTAVLLSKHLERIHYKEYLNVLLLPN